MTADLANSIYRTLRAWGKQFCGLRSQNWNLWAELQTLFFITWLTAPLQWSSIMLWGCFLVAGIYIQSRQNLSLWPSLNGLVKYQTWHLWRDLKPLWVWAPFSSFVIFSIPLKSKLIMQHKTHKTKKNSYQVHLDDMSCHKFGPIHQAICPSHLNHFTLGWGSKLSTVSVLTEKSNIVALGNLTKAFHPIMCALL